MQITFRSRSIEQPITLEELNEFESLIGHSLPSDYRQHMLAHNGSIVQQKVDHINYPDGGKGIAKFYPIKYGSDTMEDIFSDLNDIIPSGYLSIGATRDQGEIIISLNNDNTYGIIKEWYPDGSIYDLSSSFTQLLNDMVESKE